MASGDTVYQCDSTQVRTNMDGKDPGRNTGNGFQTTLQGSDGTVASIFDIIGVSSGSLSTPFDASKTYDVIIKEH